MNTPSHPESYRDKNLKSKIYLIGYMGSGKTHFGKKLALALGYDFLDLDEWIEAKENLSVSEIFEKKGEKYFRLLEKEALEKTKDLKNLVIATGGGTPCFFNNMDFILENGLSIWLQVSVAGLQNRIGSSIGTRPVLKDLEATQLTNKITAQLAERIPFYERAQMKIETETGSVKEWFALISKRI